MRYLPSGTCSAVIGLGSVLLPQLGTLMMPASAIAQTPPPSEASESSALATTVANLFSSEVHWETGYLDHQGSYRSGTPTWGNVTSTRGQFNNSATTQNHLVRRWISPFTGTVNLDTFFRVNAESAIAASVRVNSLSLTIAPQQNATQTGVNLGSMNVKAGEAIDFIFSPTADGKGDFDFATTMSVPAGLVFLNQTRQVANPYNSPPIQPGEIVVTPVPFDLTVKQIDPDPANVRSGPSRTFPVQRTFTSGDSISFDAWTRGEFVNEGYGAGDRWYRIVGTNLWMSETVINGAPPALPPVPAFVTVDATSIGFVTNNTVYESSMGYAPGTYFDLFNHSSTTVGAFAAVQNQQSLGSFLTQSTTPTNTAKAHWHLDIRDTVVPNMRDGIASTMTEQLQAKLTASYLPSNCIGSYCPSAAEHKGSVGRYSTVGLLEAAAEAAMIGGGQGFIPFPLENRQVNSISVGSSLGLATTSVLLSAPLPMQTAFTPEGFEFFMQNRAKYSNGNWIDGWLEAVEFILTDPDGFQLGYRDGLEFNNIPNATLDKTTFVQTSSLGLPTLAEAVAKGLISPDSNSSPQLPPVNPAQPVENLFQFVVGDRKPGQYLLQLWGLSENSKAIIRGGNENGKDESTIIYPGAGGTEVRVGAVPEPSEIGGSVLVGMIGTWLWRRKRKH